MPYRTLANTWTAPRMDFLAPLQGTTVGTWARVYVANIGWVRYNSSLANGDVGAWIVDLAPGTWTMTVRDLKGSNCGKVNIDYTDITAVTWHPLATALDRYAAATTTDINDYTGIVVTSHSFTIIRFTLNGKNASSSAYAVDLMEASFTRTA